MSFVKRDKSKNAIGVRFVFDQTDTVKTVRELRQAYTDAGFVETHTTKKLTDAQVLKACREK